MSDFFENNQNENEPVDDNALNNAAEDVELEESTVFSAPVEHNDKAPKKNKKKRIVSIIAAALAVAVLAGGTIAVIRFIPELKEDEVASSIFEDISLIDKDSSTFNAINITNTNGTFKFVSKQITSAGDDGQSQTTTYWDMDGIDISKLSSDSLKSIVAAAANLTAVREITTKSPDECGFNEPLIKVSVEDSTNGSFAFSVGAQSPDGLGYYLMLDGSDKIYVVSTNELSDFQFELIDLSDKTAIPTTIFTSDTSENKTVDGSYAYFDSLTISGKLYPETVTVTNNSENNASAEIVPYVITTPSKRYAQSQSMSSLINLFSKETTVYGNYAFDINDQTLKEVGLDNPDAVITMTIKGESKTFKISVVDDDYCAVIYDDAPMIRKVSLESFEFLTLKTEDFYNKNPFLYSISDISGLKLVEDDYEVGFDISYSEDEDSNKVYHIAVDGTEIPAAEFQDFYADFVSTQCSDYTIESISGKPIGSIIFTFHDGSDTTVDFHKVNETKYQYSIDGVPMGRITSSAYKKITRNVRAQAEKATK